MKVLLLLLVVLCAALCEEENYVELNDKDFEGGRVVTKDMKINGKWFIKFYVPWCPHCQRLAPEWLKMAPLVKENWKTGGVDCTKYSDLCSTFGAYSYPTIKYFDEKLGIIKFEGNRKSEDLTDFIIDKKYLEAKPELKTQVPQKGESKTGFDKIKDMFGFN